MKKFKDSMENLQCMSKILPFPLISLQTNVQGDVKITAVILDKISRNMVSPLIYVHIQMCIHSCEDTNNTQWPICVWKRQR